LRIDGCRLEGARSDARRKLVVLAVMRITRTLLDALLVVLAAVTAFWRFVP